MTTRENRGGARAPDGVARVTPLPGGPSNRTDLSELPGTPGTPLPPSPTEPSVQHGNIQNLRRTLGQIPLEMTNPKAGGFDAPTGAPGEPLTAGAPLGAGVGPEGLIPSPQELTSRLTARELQYAYPLLMRLASLPNATTETKILAQRLRANLPVQPEQVPLTRPANGIQ